MASAKAQLPARCPLPKCNGELAGAIKNHCSEKERPKSGPCGWVVHIPCGALIDGYGNYSHPDKPPNLR